MKSVQPIRDKAIIEAIKRDLRLQSERNYIFFCLGIYSGLRVSDLLNLRVGDVRSKSHIVLIEQKTRNTKKLRKERKFIIHPDLKPALESYIAGKRDEEYLFPSRQRKKKTGISQQPFHRTMAYKVLKNAAQKYGLKEIGCHTMRKTWGYHLYVQNPRNLALLMNMFNHSEQSITLRYLGLTQDAMDEAISDLSYS
ncbi:hypothetical protein PC41400_21645 [Paenibacillus chitinolyticus]|uniref:Tyrosine-type recombinase/integrase n=1 Tax=Paenibacillus chitinolyticus TaxID=79263 RepID=A0A410X0B3_9BACL|nr:tyrosine-type recombinase/integrase [Paenibacillus chitinolyticus]MCY9593734.1 tyrosine-type recombinase/integrase [Paenibacillus chitinolyticus]MCY9599700.1 tyrosine-type recombinase/integrase [Paenibacillus chitinolyticus]QAV20126.1 hypothetical protein PC41400_21645 [Paenibacillus chitinolyticus]